MCNCVGCQGVQCVLCVLWVCNAGWHYGVGLWLSCLQWHIPPDTVCYVQLLADLADAEAAAAEHLAELRGRVAAKQQGIQQQQAALRRKVRGVSVGAAYDTLLMRISLTCPVASGCCSFCSVCMTNNSPCAQIEDSTAGLRVEEEAAAATVMDIEEALTTLRYAWACPYPST